jgi:exodeoxyribonuclease VII large subunit
MAGKRPPESGSLFDAATDGPAPAAQTPKSGDRPTALSVSELVASLRQVVEGAFGQVWVKGEVTSFKAYGSGHWYFTLRDRESAVRCMMWKTYTANVGAVPAEGTEVYALGRPTVWEERGELRLEVRVLLPTAGVGLQQLARERIRLALEKDGLLDPARKRALPRFPRVIAVVTSPDGAALRDIITVARRRWPSLRLLVVAAQVQGDGAPRELVRALALVNRLATVDICIIGRGGGGKEDLLAFDDEGVCRAVAALRVPTISAVGHETDISLTDLVADVRCATPSAAAECAVPDRLDTLRHAVSLANRLANGLRRRTTVVAARLSRSGDRIQVVMQRRLRDPRSRLEHLAAQLEALSPLSVLARGYSVARLEDGRVVRRRAQLPAGTPFTLRVGDGEVPSRAQGADGNERTRESGIRKGQQGKGDSSR